MGRKKAVQKGEKKDELLCWKKKMAIFALTKKMVVVAQLVRASVCGTEGRGFEPHLPPQKEFID